MNKGETPVIFAIANIVFAFIGLPLEKIMTTDAPALGTLIIVEGTPHQWPKSEITYAQLVTLFDPAYPTHPEINYSVTYDHGPSQNPEGILSPGGSVKIKGRMVFHVTPTGES